MMAALPVLQVDTVTQCVIFLCTLNSSHSQMAGGLLRTRYQVFSAGTHPRMAHPLAIKAIAELGIDISEQASHRAKVIEEFDSEQPMHLVVTVCNEVAGDSPYFPRALSQEHWGFPDPSATTGTEAERLAVFQRVLDAIASRIDAFVRDNQKGASV